MRQLTKYGIALFVSACLLAVLLGSCGDDSCKAAVKKDKLSALIGQLQGQCCVYEANPYGSCQKKSKPYVPGLKYRCVSSAARCLGAMGSEAQEAVPDLIEALSTGPNDYSTGDGPIPTRTHIIMALGKIGDPRAVKPLIAALYSPRPTDRFLGLRSSLKPPKGYDGTIEALGLIKPAAVEAVPHIIPFLKESDSYLFRAATIALGQIKDPRAIPPLIEALNNPSNPGLAADTLAKFGPVADAAVPALIKMIESSTNVSEGLTAARAIGKIRGQAAIPKIAIMYEQKFIEFPDELREIFRDYGYKGDFVYATYEKERYYITLTTSQNLYVRLDRSTSNPSLTSGQVWIERSFSSPILSPNGVWIQRDGQKISEQKFTTFKEMRDLIKKMLKTRGAGS
ncbi:HEAT repeat domain-containing protein [Argonema antarcticum]|uniref:HEAT repeat domain-containing protein n=1 Tax=Argonema antarcticum TaxID=2942763 RepID=UPI002012C5DC|nr:HEAT repeat domain-containing protein [Argonema antarcticum]MCL1475467.1 HEAT repeat domain-containing protein [Argonema antarcticum A004/B2]